MLGGVEMRSRDIDDDYRTCAETYATLRVYSDDVDPDEITSIIGVEPTSYFRKGEARTKRLDVKNRHHKMNGWFYRTREASSSRDCRRHLDLLLAGPLKRPGVTTILREPGSTYPSSTPTQVAALLSPRTR
jgi:hypothetical protein